MQHEAAQNQIDKCQLTTKHIHLNGKTLVYVSEMNVLAIDVNVQDNAYGIPVDAKPGMATSIQ